MPVLYLHRIFHLRALRSLAAKPSSHVTAFAQARAALRILKRRLYPWGKRRGFVHLMPRAAPTGRTDVELLLPGFSRNLVELFKKKRVHWQTPSFFKAAHDVLFNDFVVSGQRPI